MEEKTIKGLITFFTASTQSFAAARRTQEQFGTAPISTEILQMEKLHLECLRMLHQEEIDPEELQEKMYEIEQASRNINFQKDQLDKVFEYNLKDFPKMCLN